MYGHKTPGIRPDYSSQYSHQKSHYLETIFNIVNHHCKDSKFGWLNCSWLYLSAVSSPEIQDFYQFRSSLCFPITAKGWNNPAFSNNSVEQQAHFFQSSLFDFDRNPKFTHKVKVLEKERNTTSLRPACCNIFHSRSFYVGFKHAISQFNPIFPAFGALQWNRFHLILNIWSPFPLETPQQC